jgi:hypothetical protein
LTHAALPIVATLEGRRRLLFSARDARGRASIGHAELSARDGELVAGEVAPVPLVEVGPLGAFDDTGVTGACLVEHEGRQHLYYSGWSLGRSVPFYLHVGLAVSDDGGRTFQRVSPAPILERNRVDPFLTASPCVLIENGLWRMWYVSATHWEGARHYYHLRYAESVDGVAWNREGQVSIDFAGPHEYAIARPCVVRDEDRYRMWYSFRGASYKLGYAESDDGVHWDRRDADVQLDSPGVADDTRDAWDAEMQAYPLIFDAQGTRYMLYNGNGYGRTGIGYATLATT